MAKEEKDKFSSFEELECSIFQEKFEQYNGTVKYCPPTFDGVICWPNTAVSGTSLISCPDFKNGTISRSCFQNELTESNTNNSIYWGPVEFTNCNVELQTPRLNLDSIMQLLDQIQNTTVVRWERRLRIASTVGYGTSLITLALAIGIFLTHKRLLNVRTKMHVHLFFSLLMKAVTWIVQDTVFHSTKVLLTLISFQIYITRDGEVEIYMEKKWMCSTLMILIRYFEIASFCWVLMEGWYLHQLICRAPHNENISLKLHILLGWGLPIVVIIPWIIVHLISPPPLEVCLIDDSDTTYYALAVPIFVTVLLNFGIFINIIRILFVKMKISHSLRRKETQYKKWVKSSLTLIPLFGAYNILLGVYPFIHTDSKDLFLEIINILSSIQGIFVAFLFCFLNQEVLVELKRSMSSGKFSTSFSLFEISSGKKQRDSNTGTVTSTANSSSFQ